MPEDCQHDTCRRDRAAHMWVCLECGRELFDGPLRRNWLAIVIGPWKRPGLKIEAATFSLHINSLRRAPSVYWRQKRRWPPV